MRDYIAEKWKPALEQNNLRTFDDFWNLKTGWFEPPNKGRGGWSGVARCELNHPVGGTSCVFLKRQENYITRNWRHPFRGVPTLRREFLNILRYRARGIPTLTPVYYAERRIGRNRQAVLVTEELAGFRSLRDCVREWERSGWPPRETKLQIIETVADTLRAIHRSHLRHKSFSPNTFSCGSTPTGDCKRA